MKNTKKALLMSVMSLMLCVSMLVGTTFAWFTDSVSTGVNTINAGNLDVVLEYSTDMAAWNEVDDTTNIFKEGALWEPGYTEVVYLRVSNVGSLAMKYQLGINIAGETLGKTKDNKDIRLSDHILYGVLEDVTAAYGTDERDKAREDVGTAAEKLNATYSKEFALAGKTATATDSDIFALVVYMPETVGNEANHNGTHIPQIKLGLNVLATQKDAESDSFGIDYDETAIYADHYVHNDTELAAAIAAAGEGDVIALYAGSYNLPMNDTRWKATDLADNVTIIGAESGVNVTPASNGSTGVGEQGRIQANGYTFENITFAATVSPSGYGKFVNCVFNGSNGLRHGAYKMDTEFVDCVFNNADGWAFHTEYLYDSDVYFKGCYFNGLVEFTDTIATTDKVYFDSCIFAGSNRTSSGKIFYAWKDNAVLTNCAGYDANTFIGCTVDGEAVYVSAEAAKNEDGTPSTELENALKAENSTVLLGPGNYGTCPSVGEGSTVTGTGGTTFENTTGAALATALKGVTFENIAFKGQKVLNWGSASGTVTFNNCTFEAGFHVDSAAAGLEMVFNTCTFNEKAYMKLGGFADYYFNDCDIEAYSADETSPWGAGWLIVYGNITLTNCECARLVREGSTGATITIENCTANGVAITDDSVVYKFEGVNYNDPTVVIK